MGIEEHVRGVIAQALVGIVAEQGWDRAALRAAFSVERPKRAEHGDLATNVALAIQKIAKRPPREIAEGIAKRVTEAPTITSAEVAGPGFINLRLTQEPFHDVLLDVQAQGKSYGHKPAASGERILFEYVSANPTGPLLISHGRGAIFGDAVARLLEATGHRVTREYYINDYGNQVRLLAESVRAALKGQDAPEGGYGGDYVKELATWLDENAKEAAHGDDLDALARVAVTRMLDGLHGSRVLPGIKGTLAELGIEFDAWYSEESLHRWGRVDAALGELKRRGYLEEKDGAVFFKSADLDDDKDRVVRRSDGRTTYFASDIAYHADKVGRGYDRLITILGADHHGYVARVQAALVALGLPAERSEVILFQLVSLLRDGKPYRMGKRLGNLITITEVVDEIDEAAQRKGAGSDALRYFYLIRNNNTSIDLDIEIAKKNSLDNPVFYLQMGYARLCSIQRRAAELFDLEVDTASRAELSKLTHPDELAMLAHLGRFPAMVEEAAERREPHRVLFFLQELSQQFQSYFTRLKSEGDTILPRDAERAEAGWEERWDKDKSRARLAWIDAIRTVYGAGLALMGITALERMERIEGRDDDHGDGPEANAS